MDLSSYPLMSVSSVVRFTVSQLMSPGFVRKPQVHHPFPIRALPFPVPCLKVPDSSHYPFLDDPPPGSYSTVSGLPCSFRWCILDIVVTRLTTPTGVGVSRHLPPPYRHSQRVQPSSSVRNSLPLRHQVVTQSLGHLTPPTFPVGSRSTA